MDVVDETLTNASLNMEYQPAIRAAANLAKKTINRYYSKSDMSETYRIAMGTYNFIHTSSTLLILALVLDPNHKLSYFEATGWSQDWIDTARAIAKEEYERNYASMNIDGDNSTENDASAAATNSETMSQKVRLSVTN